MSTATATQAPKDFAKIIVTTTLETAEELRVFREMVGRDTTLPLWLKEQRSINHQEGITLGGILNVMYDSIARF